MADFIENDIREEEGEGEGEDRDTSGTTGKKEDQKAAGSSKSGGELSDNMDPVVVIYCPKCTLPPEYCEHGPCFEECLPWILSNCPEELSDEMLAKMTGDSLEVDDDETEEGTKKKKKGGPKLKKTVELVGETKVVIAKVQRQKRKFITAVAGLDTVPGLKLKDASKAFGKKFSSGASINESATGNKEIVIQGDVAQDLPEFLIEKFNVPAHCIYFLENKELIPFA